MCSVLNVKSLHEATLLVEGYVRLHQLQNVPQALNKLFLQFYNDITFVELKGDELQQFLCVKHKEKFHGPLVEIMGLKWQIIFFPNGELENEQGYVQFYLELVDAPSSLNRVIIYYVMYCLEADYECRSCHRFVRIGNATAWPPFNVKLCDYAQTKALHFCCYVDIKHVVYNKTNKTKQQHVQDSLQDAAESEQAQECEADEYVKAITVPKYCEFKWEIFGDLLDRFRASECGQGLYSPNYGNDTWCLVVAPNGDNREHQGVFCAGPKILQLPVGVAAMEVEYTLESSHKNIHWSERKLFHFNKKCAEWPGSTFAFEDLQEMQQLWIKVSNKIVRVYDYAKADEIEEAKWSQYGITD